MRDPGDMHHFAMPISQPGDLVALTQADDVARAVENFLSEHKLRQFVDDFFDGKLEQTLASEDAAEPEAGEETNIVTVIGTTFEPL